MRSTKKSPIVAAVASTTMGLSDFKVVEATNRRILLDLEKQRDQFVLALTKWNDQYFQYVNDHEVYRKAVEAIRLELNHKMPPEAIVEKFATGLQIEMNDIQTIHMIPSIYFSPLHTFSIFKEKLFVWYPIKAEQSDFDQILNVAKCLSDRNRLTSMPRWIECCGG